MASYSENDNHEQTDLHNGRVTIRPGREKSILQRHPWIFSGAIAHAEDATPGSIVTVTMQDGTFMARGYWNAHSQIQVRVLTWEDEAIDEAWWRSRLVRAIDARRTPELPEACRLVNAENDYLPGLVVDRYGDWLVLQAQTLGIDQRKQEIAAILADLLSPAGIYERSDIDVRAKEGLDEICGVLWGEAPPETLAVQTAAGKTLVDLYKGHKTGAYLDQSANQRVLDDLLARVVATQNEPLRTLNLFSYTGSFGLIAARYGHVTNVDSSPEALELARANAALNDLPEGRISYMQANVFQYLRDLGANGEKFDVIVLDPPKFAHNRKQVDKATRGYKDINLSAFRLVKPGGYLLTFSCSGAISADLFQKVVFGALADSGRDAQILQHLGQAGDHPVALTFPEGAYLKGLLLRVW